MTAVIVVVIVVILENAVSSPPVSGFDISYPQCGHSYPASPLFGIVGVDGGRSNVANPCLADQMSWAHGSPGQRRPPQPRLSLYINTGNPGGDHVADWPTDGSTGPYGACNGALTNACSYIYGVQRAAYSYRLVAAHDAAAARTAPWWLDVEILASWAGTYKLNIAALQGFLAGLRSAGARAPIGIYSTRAQWKDITGLTAETTTAAFGRRLPDWVAGTDATRADAFESCESGGFTGSDPALAQYRSDSFDADVRCGSTR